jgi:hypothetical protein
MIEPAAPEPDNTAGPKDCVHQWRLVSVESDGNVEVREYLCTDCPAVLITDSPP